MPVLQNLMEETVFQAIQDLATENVCTCEQCRLDIAAIALNNLPPRYVVTPKGASYARADLLEMQKYIDVIGAVTKAINLVKEHPRHNIKPVKKSGS
ncbi:MAG TPA: competence protein ComFB [Firmicutes bacterium]|jgi:competence protein ComFB|nr:late competence development ComFB family protein [Bacillota bacterium]HAA34501.1 competence protein ComFB [Bacillota bacterium]